MGLDLYIEARIREKTTGRVISAGTEDRYAEDEDRGFFEICWWRGWIFADIRAELAAISNRHAGTHYTDSDFVIPVPQSALREIYAHIVKRTCLAGDEKLEIPPCSSAWKERSAYEGMNLDNAGKLHRLLYVLDSIEYTNYIHVDDKTGAKYIPAQSDLKQFGGNPQAYVWDIRIDNSY